MTAQSAAAAPVTRRSLLASAATAGAGGALAACAPAVAPAAPPAPAGPGASAEAAWEQRWDDLVAAAREEGQLQLATLTGPGYAKGIGAFEAAFPGIKVDSQAFASASVLIPKVIDERKAGVYSWDVAQFSIVSMLATLRRTGAFASVKAQLFRPDVVDDKNWNDGFTNTFVDNDKERAFMFSAEGGTLIYVNSDIIDSAEIKSVRDLLKPQYKGKFMWADVRTGYTYTWMWGVRQRLGDEVLKGLVVDQEPAFSRDTRQIAEAIVRGRYPIVCGIVPSVLKEFQEQGLGRNVRELDVPEAQVITSSGGLFSFDKAPHPNASKLFLNWILTKDAQDAWCKAMAWNSRRSDVPPYDPARAIRKGVQYANTQAEAAIKPQEQTRRYLEQLVAARS